MNRVCRNQHGRKKKRVNQTTGQAVEKLPQSIVGRGRTKEEEMAKLTTATRDRISATKFAFPKQRKEPLENAAHVRNAAARFDQVKGLTEAERRAAWKRIESAAKRYGVELGKSS